MGFILETYRITLDFIYKISGPMIAVVVIGFIILFRKDLANFISKNIAKISGKVAGQNFEIDFNKIKESQSEPIKMEESKKLKDSPEVEELKRELEFEKIYSIIFGSQIELLKLIREDSKFNYYKLLEFYDVLKANNSLFSSWSASQYIYFLVRSGLIALEEVPENHLLDLLKITQKGLDFLKYIEDNNYNDRLF